MADDRTARIFSMAVANELHILTNSEINLSAVCSISERPKGIVRERKRLSMQNARSPLAQARGSVSRVTRLLRVQRRKAHSKPTGSREAKKTRKVKR